MTRDCPMAPLSCPSPHSSTSWEKFERCPQSPASCPGSPIPFLSPPTWIRLLILRERIPWSAVCAVLWGWGRLGLGVGAESQLGWDHLLLLRPGTMVATQGRWGVVTAPHWSLSPAGGSSR